MSSESSTPMETISSSILKPAQTYQEHMDIIKKRTEVNPKVLVGGLIVAVILTTTKWFSSYVTCLVGVLCPTYMSLKAIESPEDDDDKQFLTYWVVYGVFSVIDIFTAFLIKVIPFYYTIKLMFLIWLFMPNFKGAVYIYNLVIGPLFRKYESKFDKGVNKIIRKGQEVAEKAKETLEENKINIIKGATVLRKKVE